MAQIKIDADFENGNVEILEINDSLQKIFFQPALINSNNTTRCWFYFKVRDIDTSQKTVLTVKTTQVYIAPDYPVYSYDNKKWNRLKTDSIVGNYKYYSHKFSSDSFWFATGYPYTYSRMLNMVEKLSIFNFVDTSTLCNSEAGLRVPLVSISEDTSKADYMMWIIARQHAFESVANYFLEGMIDFLSDTISDAVYFRRKIRTFVVPMMDVDNVWRGASGRMQKPVDFNRDWTDTSYWNAVKTVKSKIFFYSKKYEYLVFVDVHGTYPGGQKPLTGIFNIYKRTQPQYFNINLFLWDYKKISNNFLRQIKSFSKKNFADLYNSGQNGSSVEADFFSTTVECDWNYKNSDNSIIDTNNLRQRGYDFMRALSVSLKKVAK